MKSKPRGRRIRIAVAVLCTSGFFLLACAYVATLKSKQQRCANNLKAIGQAMSLYWVPPSSTSHEALIRWVGDGILAADQTICPLDGQEYQLSVPVEAPVESSAILARAPDWEPLVSLPWLVSHAAGTSCTPMATSSFNKRLVLPGEP